MMRQKKDTKSTSDSNPEMSLTDIVIVGMACRFPQANHYTTFWDNLANGVDSVRRLPQIDGMYQSSILKILTPLIRVLENGAVCWMMCILLTTAF